MREEPIVNSHGLHLRSRQPPVAAAVTSAATADEKRAADFAWRVHTAQANWANHADVKASILLVLEGGALYAVLSALSVGGFLTRLGGRMGSLAVAAGISALLLAISAAAIAIFPRMGRRQAASRRPHAIYFGDLRRWQATELRGHLAELTEDYELEMLSQQLTRMSRRNWAKHRWVQISLILSLTGILIIAISALISASN
jgi:hypothetical protein